MSSSDFSNLRIHTDCTLEEIDVKEQEQECQSKTQAAVGAKAGKSRRRHPQAPRRETTRPAGRSTHCPEPAPKEW